MEESIRFDSRVVVVTGAGGGLGRSHALLFASRGAKVVVNDLGGSLDGTGAQKSAADVVVSEIKAAGGEAVASYDSVATEEGANGIIQTAIDTFGKVDVVVNNAGILRDVSFHKMALAQWDAVLSVHLGGTMNVTRAAWTRFREQRYGRIINTTSAAGLYGNFGQASYAAAKLGIVGLTKTLAQEGRKYGIHANVIAPVAKSRMTETIPFPEGTLDRLDPALVSPLVAWLASEQCADTGEIFSVGGGYVARVALVEAQGVVFPGTLTPEHLRAKWSEVRDVRGGDAFPDAMSAIEKALTAGHAASKDASGKPTK